MEKIVRESQRITKRITALKEGLRPLSESVTATLCMCVDSGRCCLWSEKERNNAWADRQSLASPVHQPCSQLAQQDERPQLKKAGRTAICHSMRGEHNHGRISMINDLF